MKKIILILITIFFTSNVYAHSTKNYKFDLKANCTKKKSTLKWVSKNKNTKGGELIRFQSYTGFDQRTVLIGAHKNNPIEITGYLQLPKGSDKVPIVIWTHSSGGPKEYVWNQFIYHGTKNLLEAGIGVMYVDNFCHRGARETWRDQSKVPLINGAIDAIMAYKLLQSHSRSNGKFGITGHSRGGNNSLYVADVKFTSLFLEGTRGFDAILPEAAECKLAGFFDKPELTSNSKLLYVHGAADDYTLPNHCEDYVKKIKSEPGKVEIDLKKGWYHGFHFDQKPKKYKAMTVHKCPAFFVDNDGFVVGNEWPDMVLTKHKLFPSMDAFYELAQVDPNKLWKKTFKILKKEKCLKRGVTVGGGHMD